MHISISWGDTQWKILLVALTFSIQIAEPVIVILTLVTLTDDLDCYHKDKTKTFPEPSSVKCLIHQHLVIPVIPKQFQRPLMTYRAPSQAGRGTGRCWGWPPPRGAWGCPPLWAFGKWAVWWRWDSTAGPPGEPSSPSGSWSIPWWERRHQERCLFRWRCLHENELWLLNSFIPSGYCITYLMCPASVKLLCLLLVYQTISNIFQNDFQ